MHIILTILVIGLILWAFNINVKRFVQFAVIVAALCFIGLCIYIILKMNDNEIGPWNTPSEFFEIVEEPPTSPIVNRINHCMELAKGINGRIDQNVYERCMGR
jgi:hypothetical protein